MGRQWTLALLRRSLLERIVGLLLLWLLLCLLWLCLSLRLGLSLDLGEEPLKV